MKPEDRVNIIGCITVSSDQIIDIGNNRYSLEIIDVPYNTIFYDPYKQLKINPLKDCMTLYVNDERNLIMIESVKDLIINKVSETNIQIKRFYIEFKYHTTTSMVFKLDPILKTMIPFKGSLALVFSPLTESQLDMITKKYNLFEYNSMKYHPVSADNTILPINSNGINQVVTIRTIVYCTYHDLINTNEIATLKELMSKLN